MPKVTLKTCVVMQAESRPFKGKDGSAQQFKSVIFKYQGKIFKLGVSKEASWADIEAANDKEVDIDVELSTFGDSLKPEFRIASVQPED